MDVNSIWESFREKLSNAGLIKKDIKLDSTPQSPATDPLWDSFRLADGDWCCKIFWAMIQDGLPQITVQTPERDVIIMVVRYCPRCGQKLTLKLSDEAHER